MRSIFVSFALVMAFTVSSFAQDANIRSLPFFDKIKVTNQVNVILTRGDEPSARIEATGISMSDIVTEVTGKTLEITLKRGVYKDATVDVFLTYIQLRDIYVRASGRLSFQDTITGDKLIVYATTNGEVNAIVDLQTLDVSVNKGGLVRISGNISSYEARIATAGNLSALELQVDSAFVTASTKGIAKITAKELVEANLRTGATLTLTGTPKRKKIKTELGATVLEQ
jgi:hypothetical protein